MAPVEIFLSCSDSPDDALLLEQFECHLSALQREGLISLWQKRQAVAGSVSQVERDRHINTAALIVLLVSSDFLASDACYGTDMPRALQRHEAKETQVIPILLRSCIWQHAPFAALEMLPTGAKPITMWPDRDAAWTDVVAGIRGVLEARLHDRTDIPTGPPSVGKYVPLHQTPYRRIVGLPPLTDLRAIQQRERVVEAISTQLTHANTTAVALTGMGGVGKSTLAALVYYHTEAQRTMQARPFLSETLWLTIDSTVTFVDLVGNIFEALGKPVPQLSDLAPQTQAMTLFTALNTTTHPRLIILDQFENLLDWETGSALAGRPGVGEWLDIINSHACRCRFLLTSRPHPRGTREAPPTYLQGYPIKGLETSEGVALLRQRNVDGTEEDLQGAVRRCNGHPLSLSLLATLLHDHRLPLPILMKDATLWLNDIARSLLNHIYTIQLQPLQRELLAAFSFYREPVSLEAATAILPHAPEAPLVWDALQALHTQHLLEPAGEATYQPHTMIAEYARGHFQENNEQANQEARKAFHGRAARYYQRQAATQCPPLNQRKQVRDIHDLIEAIWHACHAEQWQEAYHLIEQESVFSSLKQWGSNAILLELCVLLKDARHWSPHPSQAGAMHRYLAWAYNALGKKDVARAHNEEALLLYTESGDLEGQANILDSLGWSDYTRGKMIQAEAFYKRALAICHARGDRRAEGHVLNGLGRVYDVQGRRKQALAYFEQAFLIRKDVKNPRLEGLTLSNLGLIHTDFGHYPEALAFLERSLVIRKGLGDRRGEGVAHELTGRAYRERGREYQMQGQDAQAAQDLKRAKKAFREALRIYQTIGDRGLEGWALHNLGWTFNALGQYQQARTVLKQALVIRQEVEDRRGESRTIRELGVSSHMLGQNKQALEYYRQAWLISEKIPDPYGEATILQDAALVYVDHARFDVALSCLLRAKHLFDVLESPYSDEAQRRIDAMQAIIGKEPFVALCTEVEVKAQQIAEQALLASEKP